MFDPRDEAAMNTGAGRHRPDHGARLGVLVSNLGTPDAPTAPALRRYLRTFLADRRVVDLPRIFWLPLLYGVIAPLRGRRMAAGYRKIWTPDGSPLLAIMRRQAEALRAELSGRGVDVAALELGMRYGRPSIGAALEALRRAGAERLLILPLYPQYSASTTGSTFDAVADVLRTWRRVPELHLVADYHDAPGYIAALAGSVRAHWARNGRAQRLLFSFHGLPRRYVAAGDPYEAQCRESARLTANALELPEDAWQVTFQSRFGREEWLQPYTDRTLRALPGRGVRRVDILCPGFSADCLETLDEIAVQNRAWFLEAGGESFHYIPALNDDPVHIGFLADLVAGRGG